MGPAVRLYNVDSFALSKFLTSNFSLSPLKLLITVVPFVQLFCNRTIKTTTAITYLSNILTDLCQWLYYFTSFLCQLFYLTLYRILYHSISLANR